MKSKWLLTLTGVSLLFIPAAIFATTPISIESAAATTSNSSSRYQSTSNSSVGSRMSIGFKIGGNLSNIYDTEDENFQADPKLGFATGAFLSIPIGTFLGIQPEFLFSQRGLKGSGSVLLSDYSFTRTTNYIDIPLLVAIKPIPFVTFLVGPQYSYLVSQHYVFKNEFINIDQQKEFENENIRRNTLCITGGFDINLDHLVFSGRLGWDFLDNQGDGTSSTPRYRNMWSQLTVGFRL